MAEKDPKEEKSKDKKDTMLDRAYRSIMGEKPGDDKKKGEC